MKNYGNRDQVKKARELRSNMTKAEIILWSRIRSKQVDGYKFRRQQPLFNYIVDFYCTDLKLIIEVDGPIHSTNETNNYDLKRDNMFKINGYHILRLKNLEIETSIVSATNKIKLFISNILSNYNENHFGPDEDIQKTQNLSPSEGDRKGSNI